VTEDLDRFHISRHGTGLVHLDLAASGLLPVDWQLDLLTLAAVHAQVAALRGDAPTSLEETGAPPVNYRLVTGDVIAEKAPWLDVLYRTTLTEYACRVAGETMIPSPDVRNGVNLNLLSTVGDRYERHTDSNPLTGVLFVTSLDTRDGGMLRFSGPEETVEVYPEAGDFILFNAAQTPHDVAPLKRPVIRLSAPMNFYVQSDGYTRDPALDRALYSGGD
jgi:hypothetical protein